MLRRIKNSALELALRSFLRLHNKGKVKTYYIDNAIAAIDAKFSDPESKIYVGERARSGITNLVASILNTTPLYGNEASFRAARAELVAFSGVSHNIVSVTAAYTPSVATAPASGTLSNTRSSTQSTAFTYQWGRVSGPGSVTIATPTTASTTVSGLAIGTHVFRVTVTDSVGNTGVGDVSVVVAS